MSFQGNSGRLLSVPLCLLILCFAHAVLAKKKPPAHPVNLNTATSAELQLVPGIGPATADRILEMRKSYGAFKSVDDLLAIKGIGAKRLDKMRKYLTVGKAAPAKNPATSTQAVPAKVKSPPEKATAEKPPAKDDEEQ